MKLLYSILLCILLSSCVATNTSTNPLYGGSNYIVKNGDIITNSFYEGQVITLQITWNADGFNGDLELRCQDNCKYINSSGTKLDFIDLSKLSVGSNNAIGAVSTVEGKPLDYSDELRNYDDNSLRLLSINNQELVEADSQSIELKLFIADIDIEYLQSLKLTLWELSENKACEPIAPNTNTCEVTRNSNGSQPITINILPDIYIDNVYYTNISDINNSLQETHGNIVSNDDIFLNVQLNAESVASVEYLSQNTPGLAEEETAVKIVVRPSDNASSLLSIPVGSNDAIFSHYLSRGEGATEDKTCKDSLNDTTRSSYPFYQFDVPLEAANFTSRNSESQIHVGLGGLQYNSACGNNKNIIELPLVIYLDDTNRPWIKKKKTQIEAGHSSMIKINQDYREIEINEGVSIQEAVASSPCISKEWLGNTQKLNEFGVTIQDINNKNVCQTFVQNNLKLADEQRELSDVNYLKVEINAPPELNLQLSNLKDHDDIEDKHSLSHELVIQINEDESYSFIDHYTDKTADNTTGVNYDENNIFRSFYDLESGVNGFQAVDITTGEDLQYGKAYFVDKIINTYAENINKLQIKLLPNVHGADCFDFKLIDQLSATSYHTKGTDSEKTSPNICKLATEVKHQTYTVDSIEYDDDYTYGLNQAYRARLVITPVNDSPSAQHAGYQRYLDFVHNTGSNKDIQPSASDKYVVYENNSGNTIDPNTADQEHEYKFKPDDFKFSDPDDVYNQTGDNVDTYNKQIVNTAYESAEFAAICVFDFEVRDIPGSFNTEDVKSSSADGNLVGTAADVDVSAGTFKLPSNKPKCGDNSQGYIINVADDGKAFKQDFKFKAADDVYEDYIVSFKFRVADGNYNKETADPKIELPLDAHGNPNEYNAWSGDDSTTEDGIYNFYLRVQALNDAPTLVYPKNSLSVYEDGGYLPGFAGSIDSIDKYDFCKTPDVTGNKDIFKTGSFIFNYSPRSGSTYNDYAAFINSFSCIHELTPSIFQITDEEDGLVRGTLKIKKSYNYGIGGGFYCDTQAKTSVWQDPGDVSSWESVECNKDQKLYWYPDKDYPDFVRHSDWTVRDLASMNREGLHDTLSKQYFKCFADTICSNRKPDVNVTQNVHYTVTDSGKRGKTEEEYKSAEATPVEQLAVYTASVNDLPYFSSSTETLVLDTDYVIGEPDVNKRNGKLVSDLARDLEETINYSDKIEKFPLSVIGYYEYAENNGFTIAKGGIKANDNTLDNDYDSLRNTLDRLKVNREGLHLFFLPELDEENWLFRPDGATCVANINSVAPSNNIATCKIVIHPQLITTFFNIDPISIKLEINTTPLIQEVKLEENKKSYTPAEFVALYPAYHLDNCNTEGQLQKIKIQALPDDIKITLNPTDSGNSPQKIQAEDEIEISCGDAKYKFSGIAYDTLEISYKEGGTAFLTKGAIEDAVNQNWQLKFDLYRYDTNYPNDTRKSSVTYTMNIIPKFALLTPAAFTVCEDSTCSGTEDKKTATGNAFMLRGGMLKLHQDRFGDLSGDVLESGEVNTDESGDESGEGIAAGHRGVFSLGLPFDVPVAAQDNTENHIKGVVEDVENIASDEVDKVYTKSSFDKYSSIIAGITGITITYPPECGTLLWYDGGIFKVAEKDTEVDLTKYGSYLHYIDKNYDTDDNSISSAINVYNKNQDKDKALDDLELFLIQEDTECGQDDERKFKYRHNFAEVSTKYIDTDYEYTYTIGIFDADPVVYSPLSRTEYSYDNNQVCEVLCNSVGEEHLQSLNTNNFHQHKEKSIDSDEIIYGQDNNYLRPCVVCTVADDKYKFLTLKEEFKDTLTINHPEQTDDVNLKLKLKLDTPIELDLSFHILASNGLQTKHLYDLKAEYLFYKFTYTKIDTSTANMLVGANQVFTEGQSVYSALGWYSELYDSGEVDIIESVQNSYTLHASGRTVCHVLIIYTSCYDLPDFTKTRDSTSPIKFKVSQNTARKSFVRIHSSSKLNIYLAEKGTTGRAQIEESTFTDIFTTQLGDKSLVKIDIQEGNNIVTYKPCEFAPFLVIDTHTTQYKYTYTCPKEDSIFTKSYRISDDTKDNNFTDDKAYIDGKIEVGYTHPTDKLPNIFSRIGANISKVGYKLCTTDDCKGEKDEKGEKNDLGNPIPIYYNKFSADALNIPVDKQKIILATTDNDSNSVGDTDITRAIKEINDSSILRSILQNYDDEVSNNTFIVQNDGYNISNLHTVKALKDSDALIAATKAEGDNAEVKNLFGREHYFDDTNKTLSFVGSQLDDDHKLAKTILYYIFRNPHFYGTKDEHKIGGIDLFNNGNCLRTGGRWFFSESNFCKEDKDLNAITAPLSTYAKYKLGITAARMIIHDKDEAPMLGSGNENNMDAYHTVKPGEIIRINVSDDLKTTADMLKFTDRMQTEYPDAEIAKKYPDNDIYAWRNDESWGEYLLIERLPENDPAAGPHECEFRWCVWRVAPHLIGLRRYNEDSVPYYNVQIRDLQNDKDTILIDFRENNCAEGDTKPKNADYSCKFH